MNLEFACSNDITPGNPTMAEISSLPEFARVCYYLLEFAIVCWSLPKFAPANNSKL